MSTLTDHAGLSPAQTGELARQLAGLATLEDVLHWGLGLAESRTILEVVIQDEFCHDVIIEWTGGLHLAFDTT